eukprot:TRINITY_DN14233_c0_g3_i1.p1 TRINITY_DN14233_c0_g3~~TRINITY_DN14233_c0_g3_i1.p1  ORF type:complete len:105 (+),score=15.19 TRINITY_DN14233_c0_g3_i1:589-903(+)
MQQAHISLGGAAYQFSANNPALAPLLGPQNQPARGRTYASQGGAKAALPRAAVAAAPRVTQRLAAPAAGRQFVNSPGVSRGTSVLSVTPPVSLSASRASVQLAR